MSQEKTVRDDAAMLGGLGILAYAASMMTHEALGHGGLCIALGGHNVMLTAWAERCNFLGVPPFGIEAAGPGVQFVAGLLAWLALRLAPPGLPNLRCLLWLYMVFNLFISSGYVAFSGVTDFGDAAVIIAGLEPHALWRGALILLGAAAYYFSMRAAALELEHLAGNKQGSARSRRLTWIPYLAAGVLACCGAALNRTMPSTVATLGLAAASSFGAGWGMLQLPNMPRGVAVSDAAPAARLRFSPAWALVVAVVTAAFIFILGPGLEFE
jgi:hypothetical protein